MSNVAFIFFILTLLFGLDACSSTTSYNGPPPNAAAIPVGLVMCQGDCTNGDNNYGIWVFNGVNGEATWQTGQEADLKIIRFDSNAVIIERYDRPGSATPGFEAIYKGTFASDGRISGTVTATWPDHFLNGDPPGTIRYTWYATIPVTTCNPSDNLGIRQAFQTGVNAGAFGQLSSALQCFQIAAGQGDALSEYVVGRMYRDGIGTPVDYAEAFHWFTASALQGYYQSEVALSQLYQLGYGTPEDPQKAAYWQNQANQNSSAPTSTPDEANQLLKSIGNALVGAATSALANALVASLFGG